MATILLTDDEPDLLSVTKILLTHEGFEVYTASRADAALELARREHPDLLITDWMMPHMDGLELCQRIRQGPVTADIPIILCTALSEPAEHSWYDSYLRKPVAFEDLLSAIRTLLPG